MESIVFLQEDIHSRITKASTNFKKSPKERITSEYVQSRLESLEQLWTQFRETHKELIRTSEPNLLKSSAYMTNDLYDTTEDVYVDYKCMLKSLLPKFNTQSQTKTLSVPSTSGMNLKLPKIEIPKFSGNYSEWTTFRDLFISLIHNTSIDKSQKMQYLKGLLTGEAEQLVRHINIAEDNYDRCWSTLESRYNNKRYLSHYILKRLLSQRNAMSESASSLKDLMDTTTECLGALTNLGIDVSTWDIIVIHIITLKLDPESRKQWELQVTSSATTVSLPTFNQFKEFLTNRYRALEFLDARSPVNRAQQPKVFYSSKTECKYCNDSHKIANCHKFTQADVKTRRNFVEQNRLCFNCLGFNHSAKQCLIPALCRVCKRKHHSLLHPTDTSTSITDSGNDLQLDGSKSTSPKTNAVPSGSLEPGSVATFFSSGGRTDHSQILLATALVRAEAKNGRTYTIRALLDQGSQASFITEATVQYLGLKKLPVRGYISGIEENKNVTSKYMVEIKLTSMYDSSIMVLVQAYVLKTITTFLPGKKMVPSNWVLELPLADPQYFIPNKINILLGADIYGRVIREGIRKGPNGALLAQATSFGWILSGLVEEPHQSNVRVIAMHAHVEDQDLLRKFWEIESDSFINKKHVLTEEEMWCEQFFAKTTTRDDHGRYIVRLPLKSSSPELEIGNTKNIAAKRLNSLVLKINKNEETKKEYTNVLNEYLELDHMEEVPASERDNPKGIYLPHFAVIREDRDTSKVRIVFDASCKGDKGKSLNDLMRIGPTLQPELRHLLMRWRVKPICLSADIVKMYRQVKVANQDNDYQRIIWKETANGEINYYRLLRVTFGTASAPYLAVKVLQQIADDENERYPVAAARIKTDFYMDDLLTGVETVEEGVQVCNEMTSLLKQGGFILQKWSSNCEDLLQHIKERNHEVDKDEGLKLKIDEVMKLLGLTWNRKLDAFCYTVTLTQVKEPVTKRSIISDISRLFDPLGWVTPVVVVAKGIIQKLWISGISWDDEVPTKILEDWITYRKDLTLLNGLRIHRWYGTTHNDTQVELHGFCDASKLAYAAAVYVRVIDKKNQVHVALVTAKTKVTPIKQVSIPRLELCGAVLLTRLLVEVSKVMAIKKENIHAWTDSTIVLAWLNSHPNRWQMFVANRVSEILTTLDTQQWSHIQSKLNPADCASRGLTTSELMENSYWFNGPEFLHKIDIQYNKTKDMETSLEEANVHFIQTEDNFWNRFSSLTRLIRVVAYCRRFLYLKDKHHSQLKGFLKTQELNEALQVCIKVCQKDNFTEDIKHLEAKEFIRLKKPLKYLNPFIDGNGIMRVGGRLQLSHLSENRKHPILLPKICNLTSLIIEDAHKKTLHGGPQLMLAYLRSKYWILGAKELVKAQVRKCVKCTRYSASTANQLMGQLPAARVNLSRPFKCTGVDYAGPINIRTSKGQGHHAYKGYICLFVCMATKAVHIEVVSDLTTQGFLAAYKRFVSRRGYCSDIWSDNGTNFVGAARELKRLLAAEKSNYGAELADCLALEGTNWHFIPPHSPNFGGLWEAGVKSVKFHLRRVIGDTTLTYEELSTVLSQIEACLNSRPLSRIDGDSGDAEVLTPGHFLVGEPLLTVPDYNFESSSISSLRRWQLMQRMMQSFWRHWSREYLSMFMHRYKWSHQKPEPNVGDLVLVKEDDLPPSRWLLGRVVEKHPGTDEITRVVSLKTKNAVIRRATSKLCILPIAE